MLRTENLLEFDVVQQERVKEQVAQRLSRPLPQAAVVLDEKV